MGTRPGLAHRRSRRSTASEARLRTLGDRIPKMSDDVLRSIVAENAPRVRRYAIGALVAVVLMLIGVLVGVQWFRPVPSPVFRSAVSTSVRLPGSPPVLPWPTTGSSALSVEGAGSLGHKRSTDPVPIASVTKVMTAYVVLRDHPLASGAAGPAIPVTAATMAAYQTGLATQQSVVRVAAGETLTELEALEGLLVASGNDMATLLADWDASSTPAFVAKMNSTARSLGLDSTRFDDPSGLDPGSVSTAADLIRLGEAAMAIPAFDRIVAMGEVILPLAGLIYNFDSDLGQNGMVGIKTGSDSAAGGCFLFEAQKTVDDSNVTLVGAVLGQETVSPITAALDAADVLVTAAFAAVGEFAPVPPGSPVGRIVASWGSSVPVMAPKSPTVVGWAGLAVAVQVHVGALPPAISSGTRIGVLEVHLGGQRIDVVLRASRRRPGPSAIWRLTRL